MLMMVLCLVTNKKDKDMASECKGCAAYSGLYCKVGIVPHIEGTEGCPCRTCLVKTMCYHGICEKFIEYRKLSRNERNFIEITDDFAARNFWRYI